MGFKLKMKTRSQAVVQDFCEKCGQFGHTHRDCGMGVTCYKCGEVGHHGRNCTKDIYVESAAVKSAIEQGIYVQGEGLDARRSTGNESITNWNERAEADKNAEPAPRRRRTVEDYEQREHKEYKMVLTPAQEYQRRYEERKQQKKLKRQAEQEGSPAIKPVQNDSKTLPPPPPPPPKKKTELKQTREQEKESRRLEERIARDDLKKAKLEEERSEKDASLKRALARKISRQKDYFTPPPNAGPRSDTKLFISVEKEGQCLNSWDLSTHPFYLFGKNDAVVDFTLDHPSISRTHFAIYHNSKSSTTYIEDLGSEWGTTLNGIKLPRKSAREIQVGDVISAGASTRSLILRERSRWE
eukprot:TRINITY_DN18316_c0_g1_i2.p1 TRINITY_DN18316_c0_g1~~TRINITY_DN18316_c0_g1_i2.p1  ORF type:complete len:355 (+),score=68.76 TRINITY_DN18316_c0_g1_i2:96-1160(+)